MAGEVRDVEVRRHLRFCGLRQDCRLGMQKSWRSAHFGRLDRIRPTSIKRLHDNHPFLNRTPGLHTEGGIVVRSVFFVTAVGVVLYQGTTCYPVSIN